MPSEYHSEKSKEARRFDDWVFLYRKVFCMEHGYYPPISDAVKAFQHTNPGRAPLFTIENWMGLDRYYRLMIHKEGMGPKRYQVEDRFARKPDGSYVRDDQ